MANTLVYKTEVAIPPEHQNDDALMKLRKAGLLNKWANANEIPTGNSTRLSFRFELNMDPILQGWKVLELEVRQA